MTSGSATLTTIVTTILTALKLDGLGKPLYQTRMLSPLAGLSVGAVVAGLGAGASAAIDNYNKAPADVNS